MKIIKSDVEVMSHINGDEIIKHLESCGRVCYKSEDKITDSSRYSFIKNILKRGHESVIEHFGITVRFVCDRGVSHEMVRHRIASYSQESTRYCNYGNDKFGSEITVIRPSSIDEGSPLYEIWKNGCQSAEGYYFAMLDAGATPQQARSVLPHSLKTEVVATLNIRSWRHFLKLRTSPSAHPDIVEVANMLLTKFKEKVPILFDDIN